MTPDPQTVASLVALLRPLKGKGPAYYTDDEYPDRVGPDELLRDTVKAALIELEVEGMSGCRLCLS
jgi:hypothetical protein